MADVYSTGEVNHYLESPQHPGQGGPALVRDTLEQNFRIQIDYYAQVDFNGFKKIVDAVGGVSVDNPYPFDDDQYPTEDYQYTRVFFPEGLMHLYGEEALQFARSRYADDDYARNARQQQVLLGIRQQALQLNLLTKATDLIDALGSTVKTDFPTDQWLPFAKFGSQISGGAIRAIRADRSSRHLRQSATAFIPRLIGSRRASGPKSSRRRRTRTISPHRRTGA